MTWMDEGMEVELREVQVSNDLYIVVEEDYLDLHSKQLDTDQEPGVLIGNDELDLLIDALMQLRKEREKD